MHAVSLSMYSQGRNKEEQRGVEERLPSLPRPPTLVNLDTRDDLIWQHLEWWDYHVEVMDAPRRYIHPGLLTLQKILPTLPTMFVGRTAVGNW